MSVPAYESSCWRHFLVERTYQALFLDRLSVATNNFGSLALCFKITYLSLELHANDDHTVNVPEVASLISKQRNSAFA